MHLLGISVKLLNLPRVFPILKRSVQAPIKPPPHSSEWTGSQRGGTVPKTHRRLAVRNQRDRTQGSKPKRLVPRISLCFLLLLPSSGLDTISIMPLRTEPSDMPPTWMYDTNRESSGESGVTG